MNSGGVQTDSKSSNEGGTQTIVGEGTQIFNLMDHAIMEQVEVENVKKSKKN